MNCLYSPYAAQMPRNADALLCKVCNRRMPVNSISFSHQNGWRGIRHKPCRPTESPRSPLTAPQTNLFLQSLSPATREQIISRSKPVDLPLRTVLYEVDKRPQHAYFITSGIASVVIELAEGGTAEVALIGREGLSGTFDLLGPSHSPARCFLQMSGSGFRMPFTELETLFEQLPDLRKRVLEFVQMQSFVMSQLAACNKLHDSESRLARWLLMVQDRVQDDTLNITQEFLAQMLGTRRTTVVMAAGILQKSGLISYSRGKVKILSRENLVPAACDCYNVTLRLLEGLYKDSL